MTTKRPWDEKLAALRAAVADPAKPLPVADSLREMFLGWADQFTVWHLRVLAFLDDPKAWFAARSRPFPAMMMGSLGGVLTDDPRLSAEELRRLLAAKGKQVH